VSWAGPEVRVLFILRGATNLILNRLAFSFKIGDREVCTFAVVRQSGVTSVLSIARLKILSSSFGCFHRSLKGSGSPHSGRKE